MDRNVLVNIQRPADVFGDVRVVQSIPKMNLSFPYGLDLKQTRVYGNVYHGNSMCNLAVSNVSTMISVVESTLIETSPNTSLNCRFDAVFGNTGTQIVGIGGSDEGFFFGTHDHQFGVLCRTGGQPHVETLTITSPPTSSGNISVTLDSVQYDTTVTGNSVVSVLSTLLNTEYTGWKTVQSGPSIYFTSLTSRAFSGTFSFDPSTTGIVGTMTTSLSGILPTDTWTYSPNWVWDQAAGNEDLPVIDLSMGQIYMIATHWDSFGYVVFSILDPESSRFIPVHYISYNNTMNIPIIQHDNIAIYCSVDNYTTTESGVLNVASVSVQMPHTLVKDYDANPLQTASNFVCGELLQPNANTHILTIQTNPIYNGYYNKTKVALKTLSLTSRSLDNMIFTVYKNTVLANVVAFSNVGSDSCVSQCTLSTSTSGGTMVFQNPSLRGEHNAILDITGLGIFLDTGDSLSVTVQPMGNIYICDALLYSSLTWTEHT